MGRFFYPNGSTRVEIEDPSLAHLQHVIGTKLRRGEAFFFTWKDDVGIGKGRQSVWVHPGANIEFKYHGSREPQLNRDWLAALALVASSPTGLYLVPEPSPRGRGDGSVEMHGERVSAY